jgi:fatty-acyl-CoA synthase
VPDESSGDQLVAALVLVGELSPAAFEAFLDEQADLGAKSRPRFVRLLPTLPRTATNKVLKRELRVEPLTGGELWVREERGTSYTQEG